MSNRIQFSIRAVHDGDRALALALIKKLWGDDHIIRRDERVYPALLPGFLALQTDGALIGLVTYQIVEDSCEVITLNSLVENQGVGTKLIDRVIFTAQRSCCNSVHLTTTNDNKRAIDFYTRKGFDLEEIRLGAVDRAREIKSAIPVHSPDGIPIRDEWELVLDLDRESRKFG